VERNTMQRVLEPERSIYLGSPGSGNCTRMSGLVGTCTSGSRVMHALRSRNRRRFFLDYDSQPYDVIALLAS